MKLFILFPVVLSSKWLFNVHWPICCVKGEVCGYTIYKSYSELPFKVAAEKTRSKDGLAKIIVSPGMNLNYEKRHRYTFEIAAHDCYESQHSERFVLVLFSIFVHLLTDCWYWINFLLIGQVALSSNHLYLNRHFIFIVSSTSSIIFLMFLSSCCIISH